MTTLLDVLTDPASSAAAGDAVKAQVGTWAERAVKVGLEHAAGAPADVEPALRSMLVVLGDNSQTLGSVTGKAFVGLTARLALGDERGAREAWLRGAATFEQRMEQLDADDSAAERHKADTVAMWAEVRSVALQVLAAGGKTAVALLLASVGI